MNYQQKVQINCFITAV